jgi:hypothetical protein
LVAFHGTVPPYGLQSSIEEKPFSLNAAIPPAVPTQRPRETRHMVASFLSDLHSKLGKLYKGVKSFFPPVVRLGGAF